MCMDLNNIYDFETIFIELTPTENEFKAVNLVVDALYREWDKNKDNDEYDGIKTKELVNKIAEKVDKDCELGIISYKNKPTAKKREIDDMLTQHLLNKEKERLKSLIGIANGNSTKAKSSKYDDYRGMTLDDFNISVPASKDQLIRDYYDSYKYKQPAVSKAISFIINRRITIRVRNTNTKKKFIPIKVDGYIRLIKVTTKKQENEALSHVPSEAEELTRSIEHTLNFCRTAILNNPPVVLGDINGVASIIGYTLSSKLKRSNKEADTDTEAKRTKKARKAKKALIDIGGDLFFAVKYLVSEDFDPRRRQCEARGFRCFVGEGCPRGIQRAHAVHGCFRDGLGLYHLRLQELLQSERKFA